MCISSPLSLWTWNWGSPFKIFCLPVGLFVWCDLPCLRYLFTSKKEPIGWPLCSSLSLSLISYRNFVSHCNLSPISLLGKRKDLYWVRLSQKTIPFNVPKTFSGTAILFNILMDNEWWMHNAQPALDFLHPADCGRRVPFIKTLKFMLSFLLVLQEITESPWTFCCLEHCTILPHRFNFMFFLNPNEVT